MQVAHLDPSGHYQTVKDNQVRQFSQTQTQSHRPTLNPKP